MLISRGRNFSLCDWGNYANMSRAKLYFVQRWQRVSNYDDASLFSQAKITDKRWI